MKRLTHILLLACLPFFAQAQTQDTIHISGIISSENGDYMLNVLILAHDSNGQELKNFFDFVDDDNRFNLSIPLSAHAAYLTVTYLCYHPDTIYLSNEPFQNYAITLRLLYPNCWDDVIVTSMCLNENPNIISSNNNLSSFDLTDFVQLYMQKVDIFNENCLQKVVKICSKAARTPGVNREHYGPVPEVYRTNLASYPYL